MAIYHLEAKVVSWGAGRSAVAVSAYLSCSRLYNDYDGIQHDYTKKQGLVWQEVFLPKYAPPEWKNREQLWNAVEEVETAKDSRLAREFVVALPIELNREEQIELLQEFVREQFVADGMCADAAIHDTDGHNPHAHILLTVRPLEAQGKWQYKTEKEYLCMRSHLLLCCSAPSRKHLDCSEKMQKSGRCDNSLCTGIKSSIEILSVNKKEMTLSGNHVKVGGSNESPTGYIADRSASRIIADTPPGPSHRSGPPAGASGHR